MELREIELQKVSSFINDADKCVDELLTRFGWNRNQLKIRESSSKNRHRIEPPKDDFKESFHNDDSSFSIKIDKYAQEAVLGRLQENYPGQRKGEPIIRDTPNNHADLVVNFDRSERLTLYEHIIQSTARNDPPPEIEIKFQKKDKDAKMTSLGEIAAYRRNIHRRNQKHRVAKNPLTYKEELRNLIQMQTEAMAEYIERVEPGTTRQSSSNNRRSDSRLNRDPDRKKYDSDKRRRSRSKSRRDDSRSKSSKKKSRDRSKERDRKRNRRH